MYLGKIVETAATNELFAGPKHPYTRALLSAVPKADPRRVKERIVLEGDVPSPIDPPPGCPFHTRCPWVMEKCKTEVPPLKTAGVGHTYTCHLEN
jgi:oligopeptide/dipeptide ABC transporter ATP-binding protein